MFSKSVAAIPQVVLQVVISFIVEAFVLQLEEETHRKEKEQKKKLLERNLQIVDDTDCVEGMYTAYWVSYLVTTCETQYSYSSCSLGT